jgi:hypothetical protein
VKTLERDITGTQRDITGTQRDITGTQRDITGTQRNKTVDYYIEYKRHRAIVRKMTRRQRMDDWDKFVKRLERDITGTQRDIT